jgi:hypothetical protein
MFSGIIEVNFPVIKGSNDFFIPKYFLRCAYILNLLRDKAGGLSTKGLSDPLY